MGSPQVGALKARSWSAAWRSGPRPFFFAGCGLDTNQDARVENFARIRPQADDLSAGR
jgi:hypothetical protein